VICASLGRVELRLWPVHYLACAQHGRTVRDGAGKQSTYGGNNLPKSQVLSSEWKTERVREDASGGSEDDDDELPCVTGESEGDCMDRWTRPLFAIATRDKNHDSSKCKFIHPTAKFNHFCYLPVQHNWAISLSDYTWLSNYSPYEHQRSQLAAYSSLSLSMHQTAIAQKLRISEQ